MAAPAAPFVCARAHTHTAVAAAAAAAVCQTQTTSFERRSPRAICASNADWRPTTSCVAKPPHLAAPPPPPRHKHRVDPPPFSRAGTISPPGADWLLRRNRSNDAQRGGSGGASTRRRQARVASASRRPNCAARLTCEIKWPLTDSHHPRGFLVCGGGGARLASRRLSKCAGASAASAAATIARHSTQLNCLFPLQTDSTYLCAWPAWPARLAWPDMAACGWPSLPTSRSQGPPIGLAIFPVSRARQIPIQLVAGAAAWRCT